MVALATRVRVRLRVHERVAVVRAGLVPYVRSLAARRCYRVLRENELRASRRSETVFVFGSGWSLNELTEEEWEWFARHDTFGFNWFVHQQWVRVDYHLIREVADDDRDPAVWRPQLREYFDRVRASPHFRDTTFLVQTGLRAASSNRALAARLLPPGSRIFLWRSVRERTRLGTSFADGLSHPYSTLDECINAAALLGWREIVLVGVDLYDRRYFWLGPDETRAADARRGARHTDAHARAHTGMVDNIASWSDELSARGVRLFVYNPRSLLAGRVPVYERP